MKAWFRGRRVLERDREIARMQRDYDAVSNISFIVSDEQGNERVKASLGHRHSRKRSQTGNSQKSKSVPNKLDRAFSPHPDGSGNPECRTGQGQTPSSSPRSSLKQDTANTCSISSSCDDLNLSNNSDLHLSDLDQELQQGYTCPEVTRSTDCINVFQRSYSEKIHCTSQNFLDPNVRSDGYVPSSERARSQSDFYIKSPVSLKDSVRPITRATSVPYLSYKNIRRTSVTPSVRSSDNGSVSTYKPRKRLSCKFESLDYNVVESQRFLQDHEKEKPQRVRSANLTRWFINFLVGVYVAVIAIVVAMAITYISKAKFMGIYALFEDCDHVVCLIAPTVVWLVINVFLVSVGSYMVAFHAPHAAGSGIPQIKCYLNGIKLPGLLSLKTLVAKAGGVILSVTGGLACGKEGPMIHSGAICASGMSRGEFHCCGKKCAPAMCAPIRTDEERRDFVAAGSAAGVSAAFGAPVGGVLFSLEEGASFIKQGLTWRMLFSSATASLMLNLMMSAIKGHPEDMSSPGLVSFGHMGDVSFKTWELPIFMVMAAFGGLSGAIFVQINYKMTLWRRRYFELVSKLNKAFYQTCTLKEGYVSSVNKEPSVKDNTDYSEVLKKNWLKMLEAAVVAASSALILVVLIYAVPDCAPIKDFVPPLSDNNTLENETFSTEIHNLHRRSSDVNDTHVDFGDEDHGHHSPYGLHGSHGYTFQGFCPYGEHNRMADILFKTPEGGLHAMLHAPVDGFTFLPLLVLFVVYHLLATWTYGLTVSSGVFIPSLLIGAVWGRIFGMVIMQFLPAAGTNIAKYCLIGAACQLGGTVRMTISLTVIVIECTGDITFGIPIMLSLIIAKWVGDFFNTGIYDLHIEIMGIPLLPWDPPELTNTITAAEVMSSPVVSLRTVENIGRIDSVLEDEDTSHNGFPVVEDYEPEGFDKLSSSSYGRLKGFILKQQLTNLLQADGQKISEEEKENKIDLRMHMDKAPFTVQEDVSLPRIFKLFRGLGLRHLVVVNDRNRVVGMITRLNLARFRGEMHKGKFKLEELEILED